MMRNTLGIVIILLACVSLAAGQEQRVVLPVTADAGVSSFRGKTRFSNGAGPSTTIRQNQNWSGFENKDVLFTFALSEGGGGGRAGRGSQPAEPGKGVKGWTVSKANLHVFIAKGDMFGVGLCTFLAPWQEPRTLNWDDPAGALSWDFAKNPARDAKPAAENWWAWPGSAIYSVCWSNPCARYHNAAPGDLKRQPTADKRFVELIVPVDPKLIESVAAGVSYGLIMTDDKGQVTESLSLLGPGTPYAANESEDTWLFTQEVQDPALRPFVEVFGEAVDKAPPAAPKDVKVVSVGTDGVAAIEFVAPGDDGEKGTALAYEVESMAMTQELSGQIIAKPLPRWAIPKPVEAGKVQRLPVFTLASGKYTLQIKALDEAGNRGPAASVELTIPAKPSADLVKADAKNPAAQTPKAGGAGLTVSAVPDLVQVDPASGEVLADGEQYQSNASLLAGNAVWDGAKVALQAAANEVAAFQLILNGKADKVTLTAGDLAGPEGKKIAGANIKLYRLWYVASQPGGARRRGAAAQPREAEYYGDACLPLEAPFDTSFAIPTADNKLPAQLCQAVYVDVYVPRGTAAGQYAGKISIETPAGKQDVDLAVEVLGLGLPDKPRFLGELNHYHTVLAQFGVDFKKEPARANELTRKYYALAHQHRMVLNILGYTHASRVDQDYLPAVEGALADMKVKDWSDWDARFGPLFDGSAFSEKHGYVGPGANTPITHFYLQFHEGWPMPLNQETYSDFKPVNDRLSFANYAKQAGRLDKALSNDYRTGWMGMFGQYLDHFQQKSYTQTGFQVFLNDKYYYKANFFGAAGGQGGTSFWLGDESSDFDDYDFNAVYFNMARAAQQAVKATQVKLHCRTDVSQPEMSRTLWDNVCNIWCVGGFARFAATASIRRLFLPEEQTWSYGGGPGPEGAPLAAVRSILYNWAAGATSNMPWWETFSTNWNRGEPLSVFYHGKNYANSNKTYEGPIASRRIKAFRTGAQLAELLQELAVQKGWDRARARAALAVYADDASVPVWTFDKLTLDKAQELRRNLVATILAEAKK